MASPLTWLTWPVRIQHAKRKAAEALSSGTFDRDSLYILDDDDFNVAVMTVGGNDSLSIIDGIKLVAPGWKSCNTCRQIELEPSIYDLLPPLELDERIGFGRSDKGNKYLLLGWSQSEEEWTWSNGSFATMVLPIPPEKTSAILFEGGALIAPRHKKQSLSISVNGIHSLSMAITEP